MLYLIAYDVSDPKRLRRVAKCCEFYGGRVEKSVFEVDLNEQIFQQFMNDVSALLNRSQDYLVAYRICAACEAEIKIIGNVQRPAKQLCFFC